MRRPSPDTAPRPEDARVPVPAALGHGVQHVLSMFASVIAVPTVVGGAAGLGSGQVAVLIASALLVSGLATLLQSLGLPWLGARLPLVQGVSFATVSTLLTIVAGHGEAGLRLGLGATMVAGAVAFLLAPAFARVVRLFPPVVTGSIITVIGLSLLPVAAEWIVGKPTVDGHPNPDHAAPASIVLALVTLATVLLLTRFRRTRRAAVLLGLVVGTAVAPLTRTAVHVRHGALLALPQPFAFGTPRFDAAAAASMTVALVVIMVETVANVVAVGEVLGTEVDDRRIADALRADMLSTATAPVLNSFAPTAFAQNVGMVAMTRVTSRYVVAVGGGVLTLLGLSPALAALVAAVPQPVLGGAGIMLFGSVAASGIRTLARVPYEGTHHATVVAVSLAAGLLPSISPDFWSRVPTWLSTVTGSGITACALVAVVLNLLLGDRSADPVRDGSAAASRAPSDRRPTTRSAALAEESA